MILIHYMKNHPLSNREFQKKFDSIAEEYEKISNQYTVKRRIESLQIETGGPILEVGSATGIITQHVDNTVICTDISYQMCKQAKTKRSHVVCCDAEMLPFKSNTFDAVISSEMIYYLKNPEYFISYSSQILKNDGKLLISMANRDMVIIDRFRTWLRKIRIGGMYFDDGVREFMKIDDLKALLHKQNFKILSIEKKIILPFSALDRLNRILEKTPLNRFCIFIIIKAAK